MPKNRKYKKMASQISTYSQLLQLTREDIAFKKQMLEKMEKSDKELCTELANLNQVMSNIGYQTNQRFSFYPHLFIVLQTSYQTYMLEISYQT